MIPAFMQVIFKISYINKNGNFKYLSSHDTDPRAINVGPFNFIVNDKSLRFCPKYWTCRFIDSDTVLLTFEFRNVLLEPGKEDNMKENLNFYDLAKMTEIKEFGLKIEVDGKEEEFLNLSSLKRSEDDSNIRPYLKLISIIKQDFEINFVNDSVLKDFNNDFYIG